jgi:hypothetical protein
MCMYTDRACLKYNIHISHFASVLLRNKLQPPDTDNRELS